MYRAYALFYELLELLSGQKHEEKVRTASSDGRLGKVVRYMYKNFRSSDMTVTELAEQASYSEPHFRELFLRTFGISLKKYIINLRLEYAGQLLSSQLYSVQETAALSGFENPKYFSAAFHRKYGVSSREYSRKKAKKGS